MCCLSIGGMDRFVGNEPRAAGESVSPLKLYRVVTVPAGVILKMVCRVRMFHDRSLPIRSGEAMKHLQDAPWAHLECRP
jgi:hypothetical protein